MSPKSLLTTLLLLLLLTPLSAMHLERGGSGQAAMPIRILLTGDSLMEAMGPQMQREMQGYDNITLIPIGKRSTGLSRPDFYNWPKVLEKNLQQHRPHIVIMWVGTNDPQNIHGLSGLGEPCSKAWLRAYTYKLIEIVRICQQHHARLIFLSPPVMAEPELDAQLASITDLMRKTCRHYRLGFIDTRPILADNRGRFRMQTTLPGGKTVDIRWKDRVHITGEGNRLVMDKLLPYMGSIIPEARPSRRPQPAGRATIPRR